MRNRILTALGVLILSFAAVSAFAADRTALAAETPGARAANVADAGFPHVALNQHRPGQKPADSCATCTDQPGFDDGNWNPDACNCVRVCKIDGLCYLSTVTSGCKGGTGCSDCSVNCY